MQALHTPGGRHPRPALEARTGVSAGSAFRQRLQPCLRLPGFGGVEALNHSAATALLDTLASGHPLAPHGTRGTGWRGPRCLTRAAFSRSRDEIQLLRQWRDDRHLEQWPGPIRINDRLAIGGQEHGDLVLRACPNIRHRWSEDRAKIEEPMRVLGHLDPSRIPGGIGKRQIMPVIRRPVRQPARSRAVSVGLGTL